MKILILSTLAVGAGVYLIYVLIDFWKELSNEKKI